ncbi:MAG: hypothetical protein ACUVWN_16650 [bacterium]
MLENKEDIFARVYVETGDRIEAAKAISSTDNKDSLTTIAHRYLKKQSVQLKIEQYKAKQNEFSRENLKQRLLKELSNPSLTLSQKKDLYNLYEKTTRFEVEKEKSLKEERLLAQLELGDAFEEFLKGNAEPFNKYFQVENGKLVLKKKLDFEEAKKAYLSLLQELNKQNVFGNFT